jgi:hypothetical protein
VNHLYRNITSFLDANNIGEFREAIENFFAATPKPGETVFAFSTRLQEYVREIEKLQHVTGDTGGVTVPAWQITMKLLKPISSQPQYTLYMQEIYRKSKTEFLALTPDQIIAEVHRMESGRKQYHQTDKPSDKPVVNKAIVEEGGRDTEKPERETKQNQRPNKSRQTKPLRDPDPQWADVPEGVCRFFWTKGECPRKGCRFVHKRQKDGEVKEGAKQDEAPKPLHLRRRSPSRAGSPRRSSKGHSPYPSRSPTRSRPRSSSGFSEEERCTVCGQPHTGPCGFKGQCYVCGGQHKACCCPERVRIHASSSNPTFANPRGRPRSYSAEAELETQHAEAEEPEVVAE